LKAYKILTSLLFATLQQSFAVSASDSFDAAAKIAGVNRVIIERIVLVESGGNPYAINTNSELGSFKFKSRAAAEYALSILLAKGYRSIDVGAAQINLRWHPDLYRSPSELLDVRKNIIAAGHVLRKNREAGAKDVRETVGRYHSYRADRAEKYANKVLGVEGSK